MEKFIRTYFKLLTCIFLCFSSGHAFWYGSDDNYLSRVVGLLGLVNKNFITEENKMIKPSYIGRYDSNTFNVKSYGAKGDGITDDTKAFLAAWNSTCQVNGGIMLIPSGSTFLLQTIRFNGFNCQPNIIVQVDGNIVAPLSTSDWKSFDFQWILFQGFAKGITIRGNGLINGHGEAWWNNTKTSGYVDTNRPHAIKIASSNNVHVSGITIQNSPFFHIFLDTCQRVTISNFNVVSPETSPNTDGIHLSNTQHVDIHNCNLACGDDCISMLTGTADVKIHDVKCGPGHGFSIGSLGQNREVSQVQDIAVYSSTVTDSLTGVRIKTWPGGSGFVHNISFTDITMSNVKRPIVINQNYCYGEKNCTSNETDAVTISSINYKNITGTYRYQSVDIVCSEYKPCKEITMETIDLNLVQGNQEKISTVPLCLNAFGRVLTSTTPPLEDCLQPEVFEKAKIAKEAGMAPKAPRHTLRRLTSLSMSH